jgi:hypothetical protein
MTAPLGHTTARPGPLARAATWLRRLADALDPASRRARKAEALSRRKYAIETRNRQRL